MGRGCRYLSLRFLIVIALCSGYFCATVLAQSSQAASPQAKTFSYAVVSVKPDQGKAGASYFWRSAINGFSANVSVQNMVMNAYGLIMHEQISGLPVWASDEVYYFEAKMDEETMAAFEKLPEKDQREQSQEMLRQILIDRFKMKARPERKELPIYELVIAKGGLKMKETPQGKSFGYSVGGGHLKGEGIEIPTLALSLAGQAGRLIVDKTGLTGKYDIDLHWSRDDAPPSDDSAPSLFTALQEQLGLKLEPAKGPVDSVVIEHIERPTEN